ncbi:MAG: DNA-directed RNA polymerase subunit K [archaeon]
MAEKIEFSKYERARILGARALQVSMDAPILLKMSEEDLNGINFDPLRIAERELDSGVLPISVKRPMPPRKEEDLEKIRVEQPKEGDEEEKIKAEQQEEQDISEEGEIMDLANPEPEEDMDEDGAGDSGSEE